MLRTLALVIGSTMIVAPQVAQARWGSAGLARIKQSVKQSFSSMPKAMGRIKAGIEHRVAAHRQDRQIKQNIKQLRRASPELNGAFLHASGSFKKGNRRNLAIGGTFLLGAAINSAASAANFATGNLVIGTAYGVGSASWGYLGGQIVDGHFKGARLAGDRAVMEKLGSSAAIRRQVGGKVLPATAQTYVSQLKQKQKTLNAAVEAARKKVTDTRGKLGVNRRMISGLQHLFK